MKDQDFFERLKHNPRPVVVDFWAPWCMPCRLIEPVMKKLDEEYNGRVDVWKINADDQPDLLRSLGIYGIPTLVAYHHGQEVSRRTGAASQSALAALFEASLSGEIPAPAGRPPLDRFLRLAGGTVLIIFAVLNHFSIYSLLLAGLGALVAFSAVYDRCPIYRAVSARLSAWLRRGSSNPSPRA
jgi:thioredoxin